MIRVRLQRSTTPDGHCRGRGLVRFRLLPLPAMREVKVIARPIEPFVDLVGGDRVAAVKGLAETLRPMLGTRAIWNVNSTAAGGGVAEMLRSLLRYARGLGFDVRW